MRLDPPVARPAPQPVPQLDVPVLVLMDPALVVGPLGATVRIYAAIDRLIHDVERLRPEAILVPRAALDALPADKRTPKRVVFGGDGSFEDRLRASRGGAALYFEGTTSLDVMLRALRAARRAPESECVLLVGAPPAALAAWERASAAWGAEVVTVRGPEDALALVEIVRPTLVVMGAGEARALVPVLDGHPRASRVPRVVLADHAIPGILEITISSALDDDHLRGQVGALLERGRRERSVRATETWSEALARGAFLEALRGELAARARVRTPLTVAVFHVDVPDAPAGAAGEGLARSLLGHTLRETVRTSDLVGEVGPADFAVAFRGAHLPDLARRLRLVEERFLAACDTDIRLLAARLSYGASEVTPITEDPVADAERDREARVGIVA